VTSSQRLAAAAACAVVLAAIAACGKRGAPLAPLRPVPAPIVDLAAERDADRVTLRLTVPSENDDGSKPPAVDRIEIYALTSAAGAPPPTPPQLVVDANRVATIAVRPVGQSADEPGAAADTAAVKAKAATDPRPAPGESVVATDRIEAEADDSKRVRYYAAIPFAGRRQGLLAPAIAVPLGPSAPAPAGAAVTFNESEIAIAWDATTDPMSFVVEETRESGERLEGGLRVIVSKPEFRTAVEFGRRRCFTVRSFTTTGRATVLGTASPVLCLTPVDTFPPPPPAGLQAVATDGGIQLTWSAVDAGDLAGYLVLRAEGASGTLQPLTPAPLRDTTFRDSDVRSGATYSYVVVAVDAAANRSAASDRQVVTARAPEIP
jgi:hypothetical protein